MAYLPPTTSRLVWGVRQLVKGGLQSPALRQQILLKSLQLEGDRLLDINI